jgi:hypothetical protein
MTGAARRYDELRIELLLARADAGGSLPQKDEAKFAADLDRCWRVMTDLEQEAVENSLGQQQAPRAPEALRVVDRPVLNGERQPPRVSEAA